MKTALAGIGSIVLMCTYMSGVAVKKGSGWKRIFAR